MDEPVVDEIIEENVGEELTPRQKRFCEIYASDREFFGSGVQSYAEAYNIDKTKPNWYKTASACASRLLINVKIFTYINSMLETQGLNDQNVDKQLLFLVNQQADFAGKTAAIREYNKLKARIVERIDHTTKGEKLPTPIYAGQSKDV